MSTTRHFDQLSTEQCWEFLAQRSFGRLAYAIAGDVDIAPINYVVHDQSLLFRTAEGSKLFAMNLSGQVAFEVDRIEDRQATSVIVHGTTEEVPMSKQHEADELGLAPWVPTDKFNVVRITPASVTGRTYNLNDHPDA